MPFTYGVQFNPSTLKVAYNSITGKIIHYNPCNVCIGGTLPLTLKVAIAGLVDCECTACDLGPGPVYRSFITNGVAAALNGTDYTLTYSETVDCRYEGEYEGDWGEWTGYAGLGCGFGPEVWEPDWLLVRVDIVEAGAEIDIFVRDAPAGWRLVFHGTKAFGVAGDCTTIVGEVSNDAPNCCPGGNAVALCGSSGTVTISDLT